MATAEGKAEKKFAHLLQPIRSLSENWDIDIATELEDYLDDLEELSFSFEDGPTLNFAEAALLIQGSACVYSRKVEYLHSLVYRALDVIADTRKRQNRSKSGAQDSADHDMEDDATFLNLECTIEDGGNIDLDESSLKEASAALRPPLALLALEDAGATSTNRGDESGNFKISFCHVHPTGALLLEQNEGGDLEAGPHELAFSHESSATGMMSPAQHEDAQFGQIGAEEDMWTEGMEGDQDNGGDVGTAEDFPVGDAPSPAHNEVMDFPQDDAQIDALGDVRQQQQDQQHGVLDVGVDEGEKERYDPYTPLDMYDDSKHKARPFRRLRIRSKPPQPSTAATFTAHLQSSNDTTARLFPTPVAPVTGCTFPEFSCALEAIRLADLEVSKKGKSRTHTLDAHQLASCFTAVEGASADVESEHEDDAYEGGDDGQFDDMPEGFHELDEWAEAQEGRQPFGVAGMEQCLDDSAAEALSYEELCKAHMDAFIAAAAAAETQTELASRVAGWQSRIEPALEVQDSQGVFDIHTYGERILENLADATQEEEQPVGFGATVVGCEKYEVSRTFSAMLQLINNGNVVIHRGEDTDAPFKLQLITSELAHKNMGVSGSLGFMCNGASVTGKVAAAATVNQDENASGNVQPDKSPAYKAPRTTGARGRGKAAQK